MFHGTKSAGLHKKVNATENKVKFSPSFFVHISHLSYLQLKIHQHLVALTFLPNSDNYYVKSEGKNYLE